MIAPSADAVPQHAGGRRWSHSPQFELRGQSRVHGAPAIAFAFACASGLRRPTAASGAALLHCPKRIHDRATDLLRVRHAMDTVSTKRCRRL
jgi:hypothetical protein